MKHSIREKHMPPVLWVLGGAGCLVRLLQYRFALDDRGLLISFHPLSWALIALTAFACWLVLFRKPEAPGRMPEGPRFLGAIGEFAMAAGLLMTEVPFVKGDLLEKVCGCLKFLAAGCQLWAGIRCLRKKEPSFVCSGISCLFFALLILCTYTLWSGDPELHHYLYHMAALMGLAMTAYGQAAFAVKLGWPAHQKTIALLTVFACLTAIPESGASLPLLCGAIWAVCTLFRPPVAPEGAEV